jgi:hypothetical protein
MNSADIHARTRKAGPQAICEQIYSDTPDHPHHRGTGPQLPRRHGLIRALSAGTHLKTVTEHSLAGHRQTVRPDYEIHV